LESVFNIGGSQVTVFYDVTVDAQNRVIVVGQNNNFHATVVRFTSAGVLDTTFNTTGYKNTGNATLGQVYFSVAVDSLNRVITVGSNNFDDGVITRYKENGDFDTTFNTTGYSFTENSTDSARYSKVLIDSKNQPLVVGETDNPSHGLIARYNQDGLLDTTFNAPHGFINTANNPNSSSYESVVIDNNNKILVVGRTDDDIRSISPLSF
jgi:uncharacterized delta-60 repeat protein